MPGASVQRVRAWALELPAVTERRQPKLHLPAWHVGGRTFLELGPDASRATFRITEESAEVAARAHPGYLRVARRRDARRSYLGLEVWLRQTSGALLYLLVLEAWAARAPRTLVRSFLDGGGRVPRPIGSRSRGRGIRASSGPSSSNRRARRTRAYSRRGSPR